jgi:hypothetical protein
VASWLLHATGRLSLPLRGHSLASWLLHATGRLSLRLRGRLEREFSLGLFAAYHAIDHDIGEAVASPPPTAEAEAEELKALEPVDSLP